MPSPRKNLSITLNATTIPFRSSRLAVPPSPFSPLLPLSPDPAHSPSPLASPSLTSTHPYDPTQQLPCLALAKAEAVETAKSTLPPPPASPLNWVWQCHVCSRAYRISVTRRCLDDGHFFCAGTTTTVVRRGNKAGAVKVRKHRACGSEFDYRGWKGWGRWRRGVEKVVRDVEAAVELRLLEEVFEREQERGKQEVEVGDEGFEDDYITASAVSPRTPLFGSKAQGLERQDSARWFTAPASSIASAMITPLNSPAPTTIPPLRPARPDEAKKRKNCWSDCDYPSQCRWGDAYGVVSPTTPAFSFTAGAEDVGTSAVGKKEEVAHTVDCDGACSGFVFDKVTAGAGFLPDLNDRAIAAKDGGGDNTVRTGIEIPSLDRQTVADAIDGVDTSPPASPSALPFSSPSASLTEGSSASARGEVTSPTRATAFAELASLVQSAQRRKSRTEEMGSSPLACQPLESQTSMPRLTRAHSSPGRGKEESDVNTLETEKTSLARALGDFEVDFRRGMEKANVLFAGVFGAGKGSAVTEDGGVEREKSRERNVKHLKLANKGKK